MNSRRTIIGLSVGILLVVAFHFALDSRHDRATSLLKSHTIVPEASSAVSLELRGSGGERLRLERAGSCWQIVAPYAADAEEGAVLRLADTLAFTVIADELSDADLVRLGRTDSDFGLDSPSVTVDVVDADGASARVLFGHRTPVGSGVYASVDGAGTVFVVPTNVLSLADCSVTGFRRRSPVAVSADEVVAFDVKSPAARFCRIARDSSGWKLLEPIDGTSVSATSVERFLGNLIAADGRDFIWPVGASNETAKASASLLAGYGLDPESAVTVTLKCHSGDDHFVSFGRDAGAGLVYALVQNGRTIVTMPEAARNIAVAGAGAFVDTRLFHLRASEVETVSLDLNGSLTLLARNDDKSWRLDAPVSAPADCAAVEALVGRIVALTSADLDDNGVRVSVGTNSEPRIVSQRALFGDSRVEDLRSREMFSIPAEFARRIVIRSADDTTVSVRFDEDQRVWVADGGDSGGGLANAEAITDLLSAVNPLTALRVARLKVPSGEIGVYGLDTPFCRISIDQSDEHALRRNVLIGDVTDGGRYATTGSSDAVFVIPAETAAKLLSEVLVK